MSNATQNSRNSGDSRRRRSRGGQNRRNNNNSDERRSDDRRNEDRRSDDSHSGGENRQGTRNGRQTPGVQAQRRRMPAPKLSWWQKLLKSIGLYKEPVRPPRPERRPDAPGPEKSPEPGRSNTRNARTNASSFTEKEAPRRDTRGNRSDRGDRGERDANRARGGDASSVESRRVYVGNLSYDVTESDLEELFKGVGAVRRVEIVYNRSTHRSKGYAFIEMLDIDEAKRTVGVLHDQFFMGRKLTVSGAKSKDYEDAESDSPPESGDQKMPPLASTNPAKETVTSLIEEPEAEVVINEASTVEIPTEEFSPENDSDGKAKEQPVA